MAKTLLDAVNEVLKRVGVIAGDAGALTTFTDSSRQRPIDLSIQVVNEGIDELYRDMGMARASSQAESTITLVASDRDYSLAADVIQLRWPFIDKTNNQYIYEYPGGYNQMIVDDPQQDDTGLPHYAAIRPTDGLLFLDRAPESADAGKIYTYQYDKNIGLTATTDAIPFNDAAFRAMVPAWVQLWKREMRNEFDGELYTMSLGRAAEFVSQSIPRSDWSPR